MATKKQDLAPIIKKEASPVVQKATALVIASAPDMAEAVKMLSIVNSKLDQIEAEREKVTAPLNLALKNERARWKPIETELTKARDAIRAKMSEYQTAETAKAKAEEEKITNRIGEGKGKLKLDTAARQMDEIDRPEQAVATDAGLVQFVEVKKFEVVDFKRVPDEYKLPDEVAIRKQMLAGVEIAGVRYYTIQSPRNTR